MCVCDAQKQLMQITKKTTKTTTIYLVVVVLLGAVYTLLFRLLCVDFNKLLKK